MQHQVSHSQFPAALYACYQLGVELPLRIRDIRKERGLTIEQLAQKVGVSQPHMSGVERGVKNLNNHLIVRIAEALGVKPDALIRPDDMSDAEILHRRLRALKPADLARVQAFADALAQSAPDDQHNG